VRRNLIPLGTAVIVFVLLMPLTCTGSSDDPREFCETLVRWKLPWLSIAGSVGVATMYAAPVVAGIAAFAVARAMLGRVRIEGRPTGSE
jgi:hypothetical protein